MRQGTYRHAKGNFFFTPSLPYEQLLPLFHQIGGVFRALGAQTGFLWRLNRKGFGGKPGTVQAKSSHVHLVAAKYEKTDPRSHRRGQERVYEHTCQNRCGLAESRFLDPHCHALARRGLVGREGGDMTAILKSINKRSRSCSVSFLAQPPQRLIPKSTIINPEFNYITLIVSKVPPKYKDI